ncbi:hypothetical protein EW146_g7518 [Bondarzewia mesenterica]|uniref:RRM domain-containing protein n=1 Tax=Bondarzewia mesenterica TaxID=1095465 RepID=A0A4S4LKQ2_9AGAM|nr:hypothetical protein EW146_g7518 [Bondarzewia mesenterica]
MARFTAYPSITSSVESVIDKPQTPPVTVVPPRRTNRPRPKVKANTAGYHAGKRQQGYPVPPAGPSSSQPCDQRRVRSRMTAKHLSNVKESYHASEKKKKMIKAKVPWTFVFVGNLHPDITEEDLKDVFSSCGAIKRIIIRCSEGYVTGHGSSRRYASISFETAEAAIAALTLTGREMFYKKITVTPTVFDLPEAEHAQRKKIKKGKEKESPRPLTCQPTIVLLPPGRTEGSIDAMPRSSQDRIGGYSFMKTVL